MNIISDLSSQERRRREILSMCQVVAPLPDTVIRVLALLEDPDTDAGELESQLVLDPALAARLLSMANSPLYGISGEVNSIGKAIVVIGFSGIRSLVLASNISEELKQDYTRYGHGPRGLWRHSLAVAAAARSLARHLKLNNQRRERLFVAGLLHDLGKMVLINFLEKDRLDLSGDDLLTEERQRFGVDHAEAGVLIAAKWNLGKSLMDLIAEHHHREPVDSEELADDLAVLRLAQAFAHEKELGYLEGKAPEPEYHPEDLSLLHLDETGWELAREQLEDGIHKAIAAMESGCEA